MHGMGGYYKTKDGSMTTLSNLAVILFLCIQPPCRPEQTSRDIAYEHRVFEGGI